MPKFDDLASLFAYVKKSINKTLETKVADVVEQTMQDKIQTEVYDAYDPVEYQRRYELLSRDNIHSELIEDGVLFTKNTADPSPSVIGTSYGASGSTVFPSWVNDGNVPNIWGSEEYPWTQSRDFIGAAVEELESGKLRDAFAAGLAVDGIPLKTSVKRGG